MRWVPSETGSARAAVWTAGAGLLAAGVAGAALEAWPVAALAAVAAAFAVLAARSPEHALGAWFALGPWAGFLLRYPERQSLLTFDRAVVPLLALGFWARARHQGRPALGMGLFELAWALYAATALASAVGRSENAMFAARTAVDALWLPLLLFCALRRGYDAKRGRAPLRAGLAVLALSLPWVGAAEFLGGRDLMAYEGASIVRAGVVRPNGPYATDVEYSIVAALVSVALWRFRADRARAIGARAVGVRGRLLGNTLVDGAPGRPAGEALVDGIALCAALAAAALPLFRTVLLTLGAVWALPRVAAGRSIALARWGLVFLLALVAASPATLRFASTDTFRDRVTDPSDLYSRAATYLAAADVIADHPVAGVGFANYRPYFDAKYGKRPDETLDSVRDVGPENSPHNNVLAAWAELGVGGAALYVLGGVALLARAVRARNMTAASLLAAYAIPGLALQSGAYAGINLCFFALAAAALASEGRGDVPDRGEASEAARSSGPHAASQVTWRWALSPAPGRRAPPPIATFREAAVADRMRARRPRSQTGAVDPSDASQCAWRGLGQSTPRPSEGSKGKTREVEHPPVWDRGRPARMSRASRTHSGPRPPRPPHAPHSPRWRPSDRSAARCGLE